MGKKPFILIALGLLIIVSVFTVGGDTDPSCGRGTTMSPGEVCVDKTTGEKQTYEDAKAQQGKQMRTFGPALGGAVILYGVFVAIKRKRNPGWREEAAAKKQAAEARQAAAVKQAMPGGTPGQPMHGGQPQPPMQGGQPYPPTQAGPAYPPQQAGPTAPPMQGGQPYPPQQSGPPPR